MDIWEEMKSGALYVTSDEELMSVQTECLDRLYDYNHTRPTQGEKRAALLSEMFGRNWGWVLYRAASACQLGRPPCPLWQNIYAIFI